MKLNKPIPVYVLCSLKQQHRNDQTVDIVVKDIVGVLHELEVPLQIVIQSNKILAEVHETHEPNTFSVCTKGIKGGQSDYWLFNVGQESLEFIEHQPYVGSLSP